MKYKNTKRVINKPISSFEELDDVCYEYLCEMRDRIQKRIRSLEKNTALSDYEKIENAIIKSGFVSSGSNLIHPLWVKKYANCAVEIKFNVYSKKFIWRQCPLDGNIGVQGKNVMIGTIEEFFDAMNNFKDFRKYAVVPKINAHIPVFVYAPFDEECLDPDDFIIDQAFSVSYEFEEAQE